jgi:uncharacterized membrane protein YraQ (UPF0718 family)
MNTTIIFINLLALVFLLFAFVKDRKKTKQSLILALKSFFRILPTVLVVIILIGLFLAFVPPAEIVKYAGEQAGFTGILIIALAGAILYIPSLTSFPLAASLLRSGASIASVAAFITTLTMVGVVTLPVEIRVLGKRMALLRNGFSFIIAILIALIMGVIL